jgi:hypothetical protein
MLIPWCSTTQTTFKPARSWKLSSRPSLGRRTTGPSPRPLGIVLVGLRPAEIHHQAVTQVLSDVPVISLDHRLACLLIGMHQGTKLYRVEALGQRSGPDQIAEQDSELSPLQAGD